MRVPDDLLYSPDHEWIKIDGSRATIGVTDYAQDSLGDVVYVDSPSVGAKVAVGDTFSEVESTKAVSEIYAPVAGEIIDVNNTLKDEPERLNRDPYGDGWLCVIKMDDAGATDHLLSADAYRALIGT
jgi:glycine cleavage system H protein